MKKVLINILTPCFNERLGKWLYRGSTFDSDTGIKLMFAQTLGIFGSQTSFAQVRSLWKLYIVEANGSLKNVTENDMVTDELSLIGTYREANMRREPTGLSIDDMRKLIAYAKKHSPTTEEACEAVRREIQPALTSRVAAFYAKMESIESMDAEELSATMEELNSICRHSKSFFPRSCENLAAEKVGIRLKYAKAKYPELYTLLKNAHDGRIADNEFDAQDTKAGFCPEIILSKVYREYFREQEDHGYEFYKNRSPFEDMFGQSVLLHFQKV